MRRGEGKGKGKGGRKGDRSVEGQEALLVFIFHFLVMSSINILDIWFFVIFISWIFGFLCFFVTQIWIKGVLFWLVVGCVWSFDIVFRGGDTFLGVWDVFVLVSSWKRLRIFFAFF